MKTILAKILTLRVDIWHSSMNADETLSALNLVDEIQEDIEYYIASEALKDAAKIPTTNPGDESHD